jgi:hypothetical protein
MAHIGPDHEVSHALGGRNPSAVNSTAVGSLYDTVNMASSQKDYDPYNCTDYSMVLERHKSPAAQPSLSVVILPHESSPPGSCLIQPKTTFGSDDDPAQLPAIIPAWPGLLEPYGISPTPLPPVDDPKPQLPVVTGIWRRSSIAEARRKMFMIGDSLTGKSTLLT